MTPTGNWRLSILRMYWDGEKDPQRGDRRWGIFFATGWYKTADERRSSPYQRESIRRVQLLFPDAVPAEAREDHD